MRLHTTIITLILMPVLALAVATRIAPTQEEPSDNGSRDDVAVDYADANPARDSDAMAALKTEIEIMRRVMTKSLVMRADASSGQNITLNDNGYAESATAHFLVAGQSRRFHTTGFYVPTVGVVYSLEFKVPTRRVVEKVDKKADPWETAKRSLDKTSRGLFEQHLYQARKRTRRVIDMRSVDDTIDHLLGLLAKNAERMEHLEDDESFVMTIRLRKDRGVDGKTRLVVRARKGDLIRADDPRRVAPGEQRAHALRRVAKILRY